MESNTNSIIEPDLVKLMNKYKYNHITELPNGLKDTLYLTMIKVFIQEAQKDYVDICDIIPNIDEYSELAVITINLDTFNLKVADHFYKYINEKCKLY